jgi:hypothetical protein
MGLDAMTLAELEKSASDLRHFVKCNPRYCSMEKVELEDVEQWITKRKSEGEPQPDETVF